MSRRIYQPSPLRGEGGGEGDLIVFACGNDNYREFMDRRGRFPLSLVMDLCDIMRVGMSRFEKLLLQVLRGTADANISFEDLLSLLHSLGFEMRVRGSHHVFRKEGVQEKINLQRDGSKAKAYQVRQVRSVILKYQLGGEK